MGQLNMFIRSKFLIDTIGLNKIKGRPFDVAEVAEKIQQVIAAK
jgi:2-oxoglutarate ferredoxin oxidoreductase subunit alpha